MATALVAAYALGSSRDGGQEGNVSAVPAGEESPAKPAATPAGMDEAAFWQLTSDTRAASDNDTGRQSELLEERLSQLPAQQIVDFGRIRHRLDQQAYSWEIWGAAYVIDDGC